MVHGVCLFVFVCLFVGWLVGWLVGYAELLILCAPQVRHFLAEIFMQFRF